MESTKITEGIREIKKQLKENGYSDEDVNDMVKAYLSAIEKGGEVDYSYYILPRVYEFVI